MRFPGFAKFTVWLGIAAVAAWPGAGAQATRVRVRVRDSVGAVQGADVSVVVGVHDARAGGVTDDQGRATIELATTDPTADYQLVVRKIGYERSDRFFRATGDSLSFDIPLRRVVRELTPVVVTAEQNLKRKSYHVGADDIAKSDAVLLDATDILAKMRPDMICGRECNPFAASAVATRTPARRCPGLAFSQPQRCATPDTTPSYATNVWVNGRRIRLAVPDAMALARQHGALAGLSQGSLAVLSEIKPEHIDEMTYVDQWDTTIDKLGAQGGLFVVLKPGIDYEPGKGSFVMPDAPAKSAATAQPAQTSQPTPAQLPAWRLRLLGVFDGQTGEPIDSAFVIDMTSGTRARTTSTGTVSLAFLNEGGTPLRISKAGYEDLSIAVEISPEHSAPITLVMVKQQAAKPPR
ncbi:MAG: hypothetical protein ACREPM_00830 [Gemmatimonadaceae bacterium]